MQYARLGATGMQVSRIILGMMSYGDPTWRDWVRPERDAERFVVTALEAGVNAFDTANMYSAGVSEEVTGRLLGQHAEREDVVIMTKVFFNSTGKVNRGGLSRKHVLSEVDASLRRLGTDYIDLYQIHRWDPDTPIEETMRALHDCVVAGKVRHLGASSMWAWQFAKAQEVARRHGWTPFVSMQNHYNLLYREEEREMIPLCRDQGVGIIPWSPLARGLIARAGAYAPPTPRAESDDLIGALYPAADDPVLAAVADVANRHGVSPARVGIAWLLHQPGVTGPIVGATRMAHLEDAIAATSLRLGDDDLDRLAAAYTPRPVVGHT